MHRDTEQNCSSNLMWFKVNGYGGIEVQWFSRILIEIQHKVVGPMSYTVLQQDLV